ncbi:hypothetical protein C8Q72DRAFT_934617 [Fomitopsis betulina]|nr:hypothetical protein C8Q72DRAFT_934617 [Fomitopsis betulina]
MSAMKSYAAIHHQLIYHADSFPTSCLTRSSKPLFPPGLRANTGATVKEDYLEIIYEMYGDYVYHPDFPFFKDISEFIITGYEKEDYTLFCAAAKEHKEVQHLKLYYDSESQTLTMTLPHIDHKAVIGIWREVMKSIHKQFAPPEQLQEALNMDHCTAPWMMRVIINDSDNKKWLDLLFGMMIGKNCMVDLGPLEVGGSQHLHGRQGLLAMLEGMAHHHQIEVRAGKTRQWAQMMVFKLYKHGTDVTLKCIVKKKGKECGDEEPVVSEDQANMDLNDGGNVSLEAARTMVATHSKTGAQSNTAGKVNMPKGALKNATKAVKAKSKKADVAKAQKA